ncbi:MAG TPA: HAD-IC family P-type ATPase [Methyloceanibacter sp.]
MQFLGLLAFEDLVREGVREAVGKAVAAGIRVIMVTRDHVATASAIAREIGLGGKTPRIIDGSELSALGTRRLHDFDVVARAIPAQKLDLVRALRAGDGVNDVPALRGADIGIAMGERGTRTAREVASIVLLDDNFRTIVRAIAEGRQLFRNLKLSFAYLLMVHMPLVATAALIPFAGFPLLYLPMHVVWLELIIHPRVASFHGARSGAAEPHFALLRLAGMDAHRPGRRARNWVDNCRYDVELALIVASATMVAGLTRLKSRASIIAISTTIGSALVLVQAPLFARLLHLSPLHGDDWLIAALGGLVVGSLTALLPYLSGHGDERKP